MYPLTNAVVLRVPEMENRSTFFSSSFCRHIERTFSVRITTFKSSRAKFLVGYSGLGNESTTIAYNSPQTFFARDFLHISKAGTISLLLSVSDSGNLRCATVHCALCIASRPRHPAYHPSSERSRDQLPTNRFFPHRKNTLPVPHGFQRTHALS